MVDEQCRTVRDPRVFAIGECALAADGRVYGLVAPGYEQAETAAGDPRRGTRPPSPAPTCPPS